MTDAASPDSPSDVSVPAPITETELRELGRRARADDDVLVRRLLSSYLTLRRVTADVVALIEARDGGAAVASQPALLRARQLADAPRR